MPKLLKQREHVTDDSAVCWCGPVTLAYGDEVVYDAAGNVIEVNPGDDPKDVLIHNDEIGAALGLDPRYLAEGTAC